MSNSQNTAIIGFQSTAGFQQWLTENFSKSDVSYALRAFYNLSKISSEKRAASYVATQLNNGQSAHDIMVYAAARVQTASV